MDGAEADYQTKLSQSSSTDKLTKSAWHVDELRQLYINGQTILQDLNTVLNTLQSTSQADYTLINHIPEVNLPRLLSDLRPKAHTFIKDLFHQKRHPAKYILVFMISEMTRRKKPYALPIQCIPHAGLSDNELRLLSNKIKGEMKALGMSVQGWCM